MEHFDLARANGFTLAKQHLAPDGRTDDLVAVAGDVGGLHATLVTTPHLSLLTRMRTFCRDDLDRELYERRTLAKLRCVRNTIYVHPLSVVPFVFRATVETATRGSERYMAARGISPAQFRELVGAITALLQNTDGAGPREMGAAAIKAALRSELDVSTALNLLCDQGVLIRARPLAGWRDRRQTYALWSAYLPGVDLQAVDEREAVCRLVHHYLVAFGPAAETDVAWWTGLPKRKVAEALAELAGETVQVAVEGLDGTLIVLDSQLEQMARATLPAQPVVNLLPVLDPYLMGYKDRGRYLDEGDRDFVFDRSGNATSTILVSGRAAGVWDVGGDRERAIKLLLFRPAERDVREAIEAEARRLGGFLYDQDVDIRWCSAMVPLTGRTAGGMMSRS